MPAEPTVKRTIAFIDGQNLFYAVKRAFGYGYPNYNALALVEAACRAKGWSATATRFYTGVPNATDNPFWNHFWTAKLALMGTRGVTTFSRPLKYRNQTVRLPNGQATTVLVGQEKGIDIRIALDVVRMAREGVYDVALIFSQDQDLSEAADEVKSVSMAQDRWIKIACAFPVSPTYTNTRGINNTHWVKINRALYDGCIDQNDYRPKRKP
ncbi:MAG: NYN domain-containing protein [Phycisphaerae bacterium]|nr:NYN domain-containing protein [Phycisphaerae bacterium]